MADVETRQLRAEVAHWKLAIDALADLDTIAAPVAWEALEQYLQHQVRGRLSAVASAMRAEAEALDARMRAGAPTDEVRRELLRLRTRYLRAETLLDFFGDAIASRTNPHLAALLRGFDILAAESMARTLTPLDIESPPALVYHDKGLGASILRAGIRLWDQSHPSPVAAIKLTRHNLSFPTALLHETGHQALALSGYNDELRERLFEELAPRSTRLATLVSSWSSELGADVHAVHQAGCAPAFALANVVDGPSYQVFRIRHGDPHPPSFVRTLFNVELLRTWFGPGPWDDLAETWRRRHPLAAAGPVAEATQGAVSAIPTIARIASQTPMRSFRGASFGELVDPQRVSPTSLRRLEQQAGDTLLSSTYLQRREPLRILALLAARTVLDPDRSPTHRADLTSWVRSLGRTAANAIGSAA